MYRLKDFVEIDRRFQSSVNLQLDIDNESKVDSYIPTRSSLAILKRYLMSVEGQEDGRATVLIGPYGKGKSHLLLVLLQILAHSDKKQIKKLIGKVGKVDTEAAVLIEHFRKGKKRFLPVIISSATMNLGDAFLMGLTEALQRAGLYDVVPDSYYSEAVRVIRGWEKDYPVTYGEFAEKVLESTGHPVEQFVKSLNGMREDALSLFREIYPTVTAGSVFSPMVNMEIWKVYEEVNQKLCRQYGYTGMFLVFDEFSKYIEGHEPETFSRDMKILQDICELAAASDQEQFHIVFVAHKSIREYGNQLSKTVQNAFAGVEGRLKEILFIVSAKNNFELVMDAIHKTSEEYKTVMQEDTEWREILERSYEIPCLHALFEKPEYELIVRDGCFPLLPMAVYILLGISEKVAQNERSVFTFLADQDRNSLRRYIENSKEQAHGIGAAIIYDYFQRLFRENTALLHIHAEWLKAEYALTRTQDEAEATILKTMALLRMMNNEEELPVNSQTIWLSSGLEQNVVTEKMHHLQEMQIILWRSRSATYSFKNNVGVDLEKEIQHVINKQSGSLNICNVLQSVAELDYVFPKQYNQCFAMTRYFHYEYMTAEQFFKLRQAEYLFETKMSDGKVIAIVDAAVDMDMVGRHLQELADARVMVIVPREELEQENNLRRLLAVRQLKADAEFVEANVVLEQELVIYEEDLIFEINAVLEKAFLPENGRCIVFYGKERLEEWNFTGGFNRKLSNICNEYYRNAPKVNNEQINRMVISGQTKRARNQIIEDILSGADTGKYAKGTSPEATIFRAAMLHTGILDTEVPIEAGCRYVLDVIEAFIHRCAGERHSFQELYQELLGKGCGARKGIIPIYLAYQIARLEDTPVVALREREVEISAEILNNIDEKPETYYLFVEKETVQKEQYLEALSDGFVKRRSVEKKTGRRWRLSEIVSAMQKWYRGLPQIALSFQKCPEDMEEGQFGVVLGLRNILRNIDQNPRELLFEKIPQMVEGERNYLNYAKAVLDAKYYLDGYLLRMQQQAIAVTKRVFGASEEQSLFGVLKAWYEEQSDTAKSCLSSNQMTNLMGYLQRMDTYDEVEVIRKITHAVLDIYIEDWDDCSLEEYVKQLRLLKNQAETIESGKERVEGQNTIRFTGSDGRIIQKFYQADPNDNVSYFLQNAVEEAMEEFGDTLEVNQKVAVLVKMIEKLTK